MSIYLLLGSFRPVSRRFSPKIHSESKGKGAKRSYVQGVT